MNETVMNVMIPFLGTTIGAGWVFFLRSSMSDRIQRALSGFAAGVMTAASVWSLLIPAMNQVEQSMGKMSFLPAVLGMWVGFAFLIALERLLPQMGSEQKRSQIPQSTAMMVLAVCLHNLPEGMAVGVLAAGLRAGAPDISSAAVLALAVGIGIQNIPEGAIISMPLKAEGVKKGKAFWYGVLSGVIEPIGAVATLFAVHLASAILPYVLGFAAGAMLYVVAEELLPPQTEARRSHMGTIFFAVGFSVMMILDVALG